MIHFLEMLQYENSKSIVRLEGEIRYLRDLNLILLKKLRIIEVAKEKIETGDFKPIGGYQNLRSRIAEKEKKAREEYEKIQNEEE